MGSGDNSLSDKNLKHLFPVHACAKYFNAFTFFLFRGMHLLFIAIQKWSFYNI